MAKVLILEDNRELTQQYEISLSESGHRSVITTLPQQALQKISRERFDLIVTDLHLAEKRELRLIASLLEERYNSCPILIASGYIDNALIETFAEQPRIHFLPKPFSIATFGKITTELLSHSTHPPHIDTHLITSILESVVGLLEEQDFKQTAAHPPRIKKNQESSGEINVVADFVSAELKGMLALSLSTEGFLKLLKKKYESDASKVDAKNQELLKEFLTSVMERSKAPLRKEEITLEMAAPRVIQGKGRPLCSRLERPAIVWVYTFAEIGELHVELSALA